MKENELRIGNWIKYAGQEIELTRQKFKLSVFTLGLDELHEPIRITEEWLVKFGFEKYEKGFVKDFGYSALYAYLPTNYCSLIVGREEVIINYNLKHVHQLQNLYFALTGTELQLQ
jgi:hypothetical protein